MKFSPFKFLLDAIFPPQCAHCGAIIESGALCPPCRAAVALNSNLFCGNCRARVPPGALKSRCHPNFPYLLGAATNYRGPPKALVHNLKFGFIHEAADELGDLLIRYWSNLILRPNASKALLEIGWIVVPIPLSRERLHERGFNQAELIARRFAEYFRFLPQFAAIYRVRHTAPQSHLKGGAAERISNVANCFEANIEKVAGQNILLIDDVATSGATLGAAVKALKSAGAKKIVALVATKA